MKVHFIRSNYSFQASNYSEEPQIFFWFQVGTGGWSGGARNRVKQFPSMQRVYKYLNRLNAGGWLDDDSYASAWQQALDVDSKCHQISKSVWHCLNIGSLTSGYLSAGLPSGDQNHVIS